MGRSVLFSVAIALCCVAAAVGGFLAGRGGGADLAGVVRAGRLDGEQAGLRAGHRAGRLAGYRAGYDAGYHHSYAPAYRVGYRRTVAG